jgi:site-specific recombinase XerD
MISYLLTPSFAGMNIKKTRFHCREATTLPELCKSIRRVFETACRNARLIHVSPHTLRHAFAIRLGMGGTGNRALEGIGAMPASAGSI